MGITGLLPLLKPASRDANITEFNGCTAAVDTYCWIYRGCFGCADKIAQGTPCSGYVRYVSKYVTLLLQSGIKPIMVFDGSPLPSKRGTEMKRRAEKDINRLRAQDAIKSGKQTDALTFYRRSIDVTSEIVLEIIQALRKMGVDCLVAPYEADAQLAYLNLSGIADVVITEDSDLVLFGCKLILYKLDLNGTATLIEKSKLSLVTEFDDDINTFERFRWMCILSGCDYLESLPNVGLAKAKKLLRITKRKDIDVILKHMPINLKMNNLKVSENYIEAFKRADLTFQFQVVFDPLIRQLTSLNPLPDDINKNDIEFAGRYDDNEIAYQQAIGNLNTKTKQRIDDFDPKQWNDYKPPTTSTSSFFIPPYMKSIWKVGYKCRSKPFSISSQSSSKESIPNTQLSSSFSMTSIIHKRKAKNSEIRPKISSTMALIESTSSILQSYTTNRDDEINNSSQILATSPIAKHVSKSPFAISAISPKLEYHTTMITNIQVVEKHNSFDKFDRDTKSRFFSNKETSLTNNSVFDLIETNDNILVPDSEEDDDIPSTSRKRLKQFDLNDEQSTLSLFSCPDISFSTQNSDITNGIGSQEERGILKKKSSNLDEFKLRKPKKIIEQTQSEEENNEQSSDFNTTSNEALDLSISTQKSPRMVLSYFKTQYEKQRSPRMVRPV
ncbi:unnamed protein product [Didymodactylos carnosus]|uniref:Exonuclease 1 n=1 Tax=Didymodactylos carnosus TaxID=1234261 RepID=A0A813Q478_9BILA|nr:unnamed protein product [Didymodactylos carnosus]CAF0854749.1 unnamed protein product [Didymodactylos carnosus]CAF3542698.1 unnamed protein product [Didymodactylos carnosus]CAF3639919.1 unnamed protein product [Didymodactylos carnosus]